MPEFNIRINALLCAAALSIGCSTPPTVVSKNEPQTTASSTRGDLKLKAPDGWITERPTSSMRVSQYQLPAAEGDSEPASLVVYYFGAGQGGSVDANFERWIGQMQSPGGGSSKDKAKTDNTTVNGLKVTLLDVSGTYAGGDMGSGGGSSQSKPNFRMRAGVIETPKGAYFIKLIGPERTVARWDQGFQDFIKSAEFKS
jgi:hypothetical protein